MIVEYSPIDALKLVLRDSGNTFLSNMEYSRLLDGHCTKAATYTATRLTAGVWASDISPLCLHHASFSEQPGASYDFCSGGGGMNGAVSIRLTAGSDTRETIEIAGCALDLYSVVERVLLEISTHRAQEYAQAIGGSAETARAELIQQLEILRGVKAV